MRAATTPGERVSARDEGTPTSGVPSTCDESWALGEGSAIAPGRTAVRLLGGGKRYEAYLAWDDEMYALVVAKLLRPQYAQDPSGLRTLDAEASMLRRLDHPVILRSFGAQLSGPHPHLVLEFLEGPRLSTLLRRYGPIAIEQSIPLGLQLCSAIHYMHAKGVVHLDVKPRNIIMSGPPRLIDLSVARTFDDARAARYPIGTDDYMSPEQCDPHTLGGIGPSADVWGWAVTMYEAITGTLPFPASGKADRFPQLHDDAPPLPDDIPYPLAEAIEGCLRARPEDRLRPIDVAQRMEQVLAALPKRLVLSGLRPGLR